MIGIVVYSWDGSLVPARAPLGPGRPRVREVGSFYRGLWGRQTVPFSPRHGRLSSIAAKQSQPFRYPHTSDDV
jgi:hypothetical protein